MEYSVKCNNCDFKGHDEDLIISYEDGEPFRACPNCETDNYLSDVEKIEIEVHGRRWFQKTYGNTYHSVRVFVAVNGKEVLDEVVPFVYGYGDQYRKTAWDLIRKRLPNLAEKIGRGSRDYYPAGKELESENIFILYSVRDVDRKKDLHK